MIKILRTDEFKNDGNEIGFIVPLPSVPDGADFDKKIFDELEKE